MKGEGDGRGTSMGSGSGVKGEGDGRGSSMGVGRV